ncbi:hypothetical protein N7456_013318 [Penicillium angulare]|uniref:Uncharacterized protein n=1 Tax=Penicillium angulare TaxID=116970 RepID=A0A9W9EG14_9EURO|nr:hypothetical protein N7456_013318 [Penicillium angulare]
MAFKGLIISAIACLHLSKALAAPLVSAHSAVDTDMRLKVELCDDEFSQNCQLHRVDMNQCTAINKP